MIPLGILASSIRRASTTPTEEDPYWDNVVALLHFDGDLVNEKSGYPIAPTRGEGTYTEGVFDLGLLPNLAFPVGDIRNAGLTIEFFVKGLAPASGRKVLASYSRPTTTTNFPAVALVAQGGRLSFYDRGNGSSSVRLHDLGPIPTPEYFHLSLSINTVSQLGWVHIDGLQVFHGSVLTLSTSLSSIGIGGWGNGYNWNVEIPSCVIDEFRVTEGVARYSESFTPPTEPFPSQ